MCERCREKRETAVANILYALRASGDGASLIATCLEAAIDAKEWNAAERSDRVDQAMLDAYEGSRREANTIASWLISHLTAVKNRVVQEQILADDRGSVALLFDGEKGGFHLRGRGSAGEIVERFEPLQAGEVLGLAAARILQKFVAENGELHY